MLAFSDANSVWEPGALRRLLAPLTDPEVGYACGQVRFTNADGDNLEGAYWRYEMAVREMESALAGGIQAVFLGVLVTVVLLLVVAWLLPSAPTEPAAESA